MVEIINRIAVVINYGRHILLENIVHSKFWKQDFVKRMSHVVDTKYASRTFLLKCCRTGGIHLNQYKFRTSLSCAFTDHMELECDHHFKHPRCLGRDVNGNSVTRASGVYTEHMVYMLAATIGRLTSHHAPLVTVSNALNAHTVFNSERSKSVDPRLEDATTRSYLSEVFHADIPSSNLGGASLTHLWVSGAEAEKVLVGVRVRSINASEGMALASLDPDPLCGEIQQLEIPLTYLRPFVPALENKPWSGNNPTDVNIGGMRECDIGGCGRPATNNDGTDNAEFHCCSDHCSIYDSYTSEHLFSASPYKPISFDMAHHEVYLSENKLCLYWDRVCDLPSKRKGGIEAIRFGSDVPERVRAWVTRNLVRPGRIFEGATDGISLLVEGDPVKLRFKSNAASKRCPQPKWGYGAKRNILTKWARQQVRCGTIEPARDSR